MNISCRTARWLILFSVATLSSAPLKLAIAQQDDAPVDVVVSDAADDSQFAVPNGSSADLVAFIERLANPQEQFADQAELEAYLDKVSTAIGSAADAILADKAATDQQLIDALEWKVESLRIRGKLGDANADQAIDDFLAGLNFEGRAAVAKALEGNRVDRERAKLMVKLREWERLDDEQRQAVVDWLVNMIKSGEPSPVKAQILTEFVDYLSESPYASFAVQALDESLPALRASTDPAVTERLPLLEGILRRLNLPGNELELSGNLLDGTKLDWDSYRGKVVLVDFWATWCGPCRGEVPNILANYEKFHDQGFEVIGISLDDRRADAEAYVAQMKIPWPSLYHESSEQDGWANPMALKYGITGIPTAILVDQQGKVVSMNARGPRLTAALERLLGGQAADDSSAVEITDRAERTADSSTQ